MFRNKKSRSTSNPRSQFSLRGRSLRYEAMEGRLMLSASGFAGNECAPVLDDAAMDAIVPSAPTSPQVEIAFSFSAADVVSDAGVGATDVSDILFILDPDVDDRFRDNGSTPIGATLTKNDQGTSDVADDTWDFSWTPTRQQIGLYRMFIIATDLGGTGGTSGTDPVVPLSDVYAFEITVDKEPTVDLNGDDDAGIDFGPATFVEGDSNPVAIVDSDLSIPFVSGDMVASATIEIATPQADGLEALGIDGGALVVDDSTPGRLVITVAGGGLASKADFEAALRTLTYFNTSDDPIATQTINVTINDGTTDSATAVATVDITATNDRPDLLQIDEPANAQVGVEYVLDLVAEDPDGGDLLVFQIQFAPDGAVITPNPAGSAGLNTIQVARDANDGKFHAQIVWTPTQEQGGDVAKLFRVSVTDTGSLADSEDYFVSTENQDPVANDDPTAGDDPLAVGEDDGSTVVGNILTNDTDADGDTPVVNSVIVGGSAVADATNFVTAKGALVTIAADGEVHYDPNGLFETLGVGETDTDTFEYTINDGNGGVSLEATVTITINGANDAPTAVGGDVPEFLISEDASATVLDLATLLAAATDIDVNDVLSIASAPGNPTEGGIFALSGGDLSFDPNGDFAVNPGETETIDFMVEIQDGSAASVMVPARILIEGVNDAPVAVNDPDYTTDEDTSLDVSTRETGVLNNDTDDTGNAGLTVAQVNGDAANVGAAITISDGSGREGALTVNADGTFTFDPSDDFDVLAVGQSSQVTFAYIASDGAVESNAATVTIEVTSVNDAPVANAATAAAFEDGFSVDGNFSGTDVDDGETATLTFDITSQPAEGAVTNNDDGTFAFDPEDDFQDLAEGVTRDVTFDYTATDAQTAVSDAAIATITVTGVNDAPVFDLDNTDGLASVLPTGDLQSASVIAVELDLSSADADVNSLNLVDIPSFVSDIDGDTIGISLANGDNGGTPFRNDNRPTLNASSQLVWNPTAADIGTGYIIRVQAQDQPAMGGALSDSFDLLVTVVSASNPQVDSVTPSIDVSLAASELTILFNEAMGASAFEAGNYSIVAADGIVGIVGTNVSILSATAVTGDTGVVLLLNDAIVNSIASALAGGTRLTLTLNSAIADLDGNTLEGSLQFDVNLITADV